MSSKVHMREAFVENVYSDKHIQYGSVRRQFNHDSTTDGIPMYPLTSGLASFANKQIAHQFLLYNVYSYS